MIRTLVLSSGYIGLSFLVVKKCNDIIFVFIDYLFVIVIIIS